MAEGLGIDLESKPRNKMSISMFNKTTTETEATKVEVRLQNQLEPAPKLWLSCYSVESICGDLFKPKVDAEIREKLDQLHIDLSDDPATREPIDILIGMDPQVELRTHNAIQLSRTLEIVETAFGWTLFGCKNAPEIEEYKSNQQVATSCFISRMEIAATPLWSGGEVDDNLELQFKKFVEADALQLDGEKKEADRNFLDGFMSNVKLDEKERRFVVRLPFREDTQPSENRKGTAE